MSFEIINGSVTITLTTKKNKEIEISIIEELDTEAPFCHIGDAEEIPPYFEDVKTITDFSELVNNLYGDGYGDDVLKGARSKLSSDDEIREFTIEENVETEYEEKICSFITFDLSDFSVSISRTWRDDYNFQKEWVVYCLKPFDSSLDKKVIAKYNMIGKNAPTEKRKMGDKVYFLYCESSGLAVIYGSGKMWDILDGWESEGVLDEYEISELIIDSGVKNICYHLVYDSYEIIRKVTISDTVKDFAEEALEQCCIEKIVGGKGSAAEKYAEENGIEFEVLSSEMSAKNDALKKVLPRNEDDKPDEKSVKATVKTTTTKKTPEIKQKKVSSNGKRVTIDKIWSIKLPQNFIHSTKCFMTAFSAIYNDGTASLSDTSNASCCFEVCNIFEYTNSDVDYTIPWATRVVTNGTIAQIGSSDVLMATKHVLVCYNKPEWDDFAKKDRYIINLLVDRKYYFLQFYIGECEDLGLRNKKDKDKFVFDMLKTIRYVGEGNIDYDKINCAKYYNQEPLSEEDYQAEYKEAMKSIMGDMFSSALGVHVDVNHTDEDDNNNFDIIAAEQAKTEIVDSLDEIKKIANELGEGLAESKGVLSKYSDYLEKKTAKEKAAEEEKIRKKAEAMANGKSETDIVNMFVTLTNEKKLGHLHRNQNEFFEMYEDDFAALSKAEVIKLRKDMLVDMDDESLCAYYTEKFKQRTVKDRFYVSTMNLNNASEGSNFDEIAEWSIEMTKEWYAPTEYAEVRDLMDLEMEDTRKQISDNFKVVDEGWMHFSTAKDSLQLVITSEANNTSNQPDFSNFQIEVGSQFVTVRLANKSLVRISTVIANYMPWYWGVSTRDIWEAAFKNDVYDEREGANNGNQLANQAITQIRSMYQDEKITSDSCLDYSKLTNSTPTTHVTENTAEDELTVINKIDIVKDNSQNTVVKSNTQSGPVIAKVGEQKKSGCYVATAVYGSYDCPEVWTLRRFRDCSLATTFFGRLFIMLYYATSPTLVKWFGDTKWFKRMWKSTLDKMVEKLKQKGYESTPYEDKNLF